MDIQQAVIPHDPTNINKLDLQKNKKRGLISDYPSQLHCFQKLKLVIEFINYLEGYIF